ncbi:MAG: helix-turn-helix domain-containing protein [Desulfobacterales bacterium]
MDLSDRLQRGAYRAKPVKRSYIPKPDGRQRPLGVTVLEDKIARRSTLEMLEKKYFGLSEIAAIFKCSKKTVYRLISEGELEALHVRGSLRVILTSVDYYINNQIKGYQKKNGVYKYVYAASN